MARKITNVKNVISKYSTIIFDFDGTLVNTEPAHNKGHKIMLETLVGHPIDNVEEIIESYLYLRDSIIFDDFIKIFSLQCDKSKMFELKRKAVLDILLNDDSNTLKYLDDIYSLRSEHRYYILSNNHKSFIEEVLASKGYSDFAIEIFAMEDMNLTKDYFLDHIDDYISGVDKDSLLICEDSESFIKYLVEHKYDVLAVEGEFNEGKVECAKYIIRDGFKKGE